MFKIILGCILVCLNVFKPTSLFLRIVLILFGVFGTLVLKDSWDELKKRKQMEQLDVPSLAVVERTKGLIFDGVGIDGITLRHLITIGFIKTEIFPSPVITYGYYLTKEGRDYLTKSLNRKMYPEIFCDLMRIRWWEGYPSDFIKEKEKFREKYKLSWDKTWVILGNLLKQQSKTQGDATEIFNSFASTNNFEIVMNQIIGPWLKEIKKEK